MANRREFIRTLSGTAALSVTTDVSKLGKMRWLRMATAMPDAGSHDRLQPDWYRGKIAQVQQKMKERKLDAMLLLDATNIIYTTGYFHLSTERPVAALIPESGDPVLFIPELEVRSGSAMVGQRLRVVFRLSGTREPCALDIRTRCQAGSVKCPHWGRGA